MTTLELLDAIEAGISALPPRSTNGQPPEACPAEAAAALRAELQAAGLSTAELARAVSRPLHEVEAWTAGTHPVPEWVSATVRILSLLMPSARRKLLNGPTDPRLRAANGHPFSRIEEL